MNMHAADISPDLQGRSLAVYLPDLAGGGAERIHINLAPYFLAAGLRVTFLLDRRTGILVDRVPQGVTVEVLGASRQIAAIPRLVKYLNARQIDFLVSNMEHANVVSVWARRLASTPTRIIVSQHNSFSDQVEYGNWKFKLLPLLYRLSLPRADSTVCVSEGVAADLVTRCGFEATRLKVIYNGVVTSELRRLAAAPPDHPWFGAGEPVLVAAGRLVEQKDYPTLLEAFAKLLKRKRARLIILGDGPMRKELKSLAGTLSIDDRVDMPGFVQNPLPFMSNAAAFVLSSRFEGFGNVLVEALACGTQVVSTDCPHGPAEILDSGRFGRLTPPGDAGALAAAILQAIDSPLPAEILEDRAAEFSAEQCARNYLTLFSDFLLDPQGHAHASR